MTLSPYIRQATFLISNSLQGVAVVSALERSTSLTRPLLRFPIGLILLATLYGTLADNVNSRAVSQPGPQKPIPARHLSTPFTSTQATLMALVSPFRRGDGRETTADMAEPPKALAARPCPAIPGLHCCMASTSHQQKM